MEDDEGSGILLDICLHIFLRDIALNLFGSNAS